MGKFPDLENIQHDLSTEAMIFLRASGKYPATVVFQSIYIAMECKRHNLSIESSRRKLLKNKDELQKILEVAIKAHHGRIQFEVDLKRLKGIIFADFAWAADFSFLSVKELEELFDLYYDKWLEDKEHLRNQGLSTSSLEDTYRKLLVKHIPNFKYRRFINMLRFLRPSI